MTNSYSTGSSTQYCVQAGTSDGKQTANDWSCTNAFADRAYSKYVCQYNTVPCGTINAFALPTNTSTASFNVTGLALGQTCFYTVKSACGAPSFKPNDTSRVEIEYVEYRDTNVNLTEVGVLSGVSSNSTAKRTSPPVTGMPRRDHYFIGELGGNQIINQNTTAYVNSSVNGTIYGRSGRYDETAAGRKVYGNPTQGDMQLGNLTDLSLPDCAPRTLLLAITATTDLAYVKVDLANVAFYRPPAAQSSAAFLSMTFAAVLGLLSLAFF
jgi:hypothetical protein